MSAGAGIRVELPFHLRTLAGVDGEVCLAVAGEATLASVLDALEGRYPVLRGTIRDHQGGGRRPRVRFFADNKDITHEPVDRPLPPGVVAGDQPLMVVGAIAGG